ncbi:MAG: hypothetical protein LBI06_02830 [Treponema sp.]|jgi:hypothetical protein|nr:hypothetical protein [Treponema sp.]
MRYVHTDITLKNAVDVGNYHRGFMEETEIRQATVQAMVDNGVGTLIINEVLRQALGLMVVGKKPVTLTNGIARMCKYTEPVEIHWGDRSSTVQAVLMEGADEILLGAIPLSDMDLIMDPSRQRLIGAHNDTPELNYNGSAA